MEVNRLLIVDSAPQMTAVDTTRRIMYSVSISLIPAMAVGVWVFGWPALRVLVLSALFCLAIEALIGRFASYRVEAWDGSSLLTGILLAMNLPASAPWWLILTGAVVAIGLAKHVFGGLGQNIFNPALVARVFLLISFPVEMTLWPVPQGGIDAVSGATPLGLLKTGGPGAVSGTSLADLAMGQVGGSLGEISAAALILGSLYLFYKKYITWEIPVTFLSTVIVFAGIFRGIDQQSYAGPLFHLFSGGIMLGALYMATDMVTSPLTFRGKLVFGFGCGFITMLIRLFGSYPEGVSFAILIMNAVVPLLDRYLPERMFGEVKNA